MISTNDRTLSTRSVMHVSHLWTATAWIHPDGTVLLHPRIPLSLFHKPSMVSRVDPIKHHRPVLTLHHQRGSTKTPTVPWNLFFFFYRTIGAIKSHWTGSIKGAFVFVNVSHIQNHFVWPHLWLFSSASNPALTPDYAVSHTFVGPVAC